MTNYKNITLRTLCTSDVEFMLAVENDPLNWAYSSLDAAPYTFVQVAQYCLSQAGVTLYDVVCGGGGAVSEDGEDCEPQTDFRFVIEQAGVAVGFIDLYDILHSTACVGILVHNEQLRGSGIGRASLSLLEDECRSVGIHSLIAEVHVENLVGLEFFKALGFDCPTTPDHSQRFHLLKIL